MIRSGKKISLKSVDDIFSTEESRVEEKKEKIIEIPLNEIVPFKGHPFKVSDNEEMKNLVESIKEVGVLVPVLIRPLEKEKYEMISGHRRMKASIIAGKSTIPALIREMDNETATILMVDANLQRENLLPSERAKAYFMKMNALKHQGKSTSSQLGTKLRADEQIAKSEGISRNQVQRFIRLNFLLEELLNMVDKGKLKLNIAVELSYLKKEEQELLVKYIEKQNISLIQAVELKKLSTENNFTTNNLLEILNSKKRISHKVVLKEKILEKYFPTSYSSEQIYEEIIKLLEMWQS